MFNNLTDKPILGSEGEATFYEAYIGTDAKCLNPRPFKSPKT